ncbi:MAG: hypothetical protein QNI86_02905 [Halieaceae bacterium]|nr:hypothetical protein [Halieaceae bacterium]
MATAVSPETREAVLVAGMHRSGTSAVALAFQRMGWDLGEDTLETQTEVNRDGFGENRGVVELNEALLAEFDSRWFTLRELPESWLESDAGQPYLEKAANILREQFGEAPRILLKDPRLCLTLPLWLRVLDDGGFTTRVILQYRHPRAVAESLARRDSLPVSFGLLLWLHYTLSAERGSRSRERGWLGYEQLLEQGPAALALFPGIEIPDDLELGIDAGLAHHGHASFESEDGISQLCEAVLSSISSEESLSVDLWDSLQSGDFAQTINSLTDAVIKKAAEAVQIGEEHRRSLEVIADKDEEITRATSYAAECEAAVKTKDEEITEVSRYAAECEAVVKKKEEEVAEVSRYAAECEAVVKTKDEEIAEVSRYAAECEAVVKTKDEEIAEVSRYAAECEAAVKQKDEEITEALRQAEEARAELASIQATRGYRLLARLRLVE